MSRSLKYLLIECLSSGYLKHSREKCSSIPWIFVLANDLLKYENVSPLAATKYFPLCGSLLWKMIIFQRCLLRTLIFRLRFEYLSINIVPQVASTKIISRKKICQQVKNVSDNFPYLSPTRFLISGDITSANTRFKANISHLRARPLRAKCMIWPWTSCWKFWKCFQHVRSKIFNAFQLRRARERWKRKISASFRWQRILKICQSGRKRSVLCVQMSSAWRSWFSKIQLLEARAFEVIASPSHPAQRVSNNVWT